MCQQSKNTKAMRRKSIWEVPGHQLCTVIGICLSLNQLYKLRNRFRTYLNGEMPVKSDYDLHACCVAICRSKNPLSKSINKTINVQFATAIKEVCVMRDDRVIRQHWQSRNATDFRQMAGYYWAIMIDPYASDSLKDEIYGEVHMVSHTSVQGKMNNLQVQQGEITKLNYELKKKDRTIQRKRALIGQLRKVVSSLESQVRYLGSENKDKKFRPARKETSPQVYEQIIQSQMNCMDRLQSQVDKQKLKIDDLHQLLARRSTINTDQATVRAITRETVDSNKRENCRDLFGKKILYVGGYARHRKKFQQLTESINGCFLYHDGGVQQSIYQLDDMVKRADAIFCPVNCISHGAVDRIKTLSKSECKDCVFLRNASLSSYRSKVVQYAASA